MAWWAWFLLGFLLLGLEVTSLGLHLAFFGLGALAVGLLVALDLGGPLWVQFLLFTVISIASLLLFRGPLLRRLRTSVLGEARNQDLDSVIGGTAVAAEDIAVNALGHAELRGSSWKARNIGDTPLSAGQRCVVERVEGLMLFVRAQ